MKETIKNEYIMKNLIEELPKSIQMNLVSDGILKARIIAAKILLSEQELSADDILYILLAGPEETKTQAGEKYIKHHNRNYALIENGMGFLKKFRLKEIFIEDALENIDKLTLKQLLSLSKHTSGNEYEKVMIAIIHHKETEKSRLDDIYLNTENKNIINAYVDEYVKRALDRKSPYFFNVLSLHKSYTFIHPNDVEKIQIKFLQNDYGVKNNYMSFIEGQKNEEVLKVAKDIENKLDKISNLFP